MTDYVLLVLPAANRVYADATSRLLRHELAVLGNRGMDVEPHDLAETRIGGVDYVGFSTPSPLTDDDLAVLSNASAAYALFEVVDADEHGRVLRPVTLTPRDRFDSDLLTIQKYTGKTNELFTRLLVNLTCMAMDEPRAMLTRRLRLLDPLCGRGTTLNQAMMYGFDATGVEMDGKDFEAYERFIKTWLRTKRFKHTAESGVLRKNKQRLGQRLDITYAPTKEQFKAGETNTLSYRGTDTFQVDELFPPRSFDLIVTDAPYGVQHGSHREADLARSPRDLLAAAVPVWLRVLRPGGALGISWNVKVLPRDELAAILRKAGLDVHDGPPFDGFVHRVDQAIERDLLVASLPH
ncbi:SAM-dependent methyltransferase [Haloechinothrix salitolerans]|uniref:TRM11 family SAM-dependent methyltransferase n=1 Tax=Haloechinothrix salitolerans TaxID=926830 RepID=A0ABW2C0D8_9PSEU